MVGEQIMVVRDADKCVAEFEKFYDLLMSSAPADYKAWFFPCQPYGKDPAIDAIKALNWNSHGSWHHISARLTREQCIEHIKRGYNIGISARDKDPLVIIDIDNERYLSQAPKDTLCVTSRKRCGLHSFCWAGNDSVKVNIPTENGEVRSNDQYVLSCGSFVPFNLEKPSDTSDEKAMKAWQKEKNAYDKLSETAKNDAELGYYTIKNPVPPRPITHDELPAFFKEKDLDNKATDEWVKLRGQYNLSGNNRYYDLHQLKMIDIVGDIKGRVGHPLHESDTDANFSLGDGGILAHCWRHMVSLNAVQYLCVKAGYAKCEDAGTPHHKGRESKLKGDKKALDVAYDQAVKDGLIEARPEVISEMPEITLPLTGKLVSTFASQVIEHIKDRHELFYRYREFRVQKLEKMPVKDIKNRDVKVLGFKDISPSEVITYIEKYIVPCVALYDKKAHKLKLERKSIGSELAKTLLESALFKDNLPLIDIIYDAPLPMLVEGALIFPKEGYDERFQSWMPYGTPTINPEMSLADAKSIIEIIFHEFCFETPQDKTNAISALLTPFIRGLYVRNTCRTPVFFYKANREGAGKDYCAEITGIVMQGVANSEPPLADGKETHDEEFRKKILATFRLGKNRLHMSNNKGFLNSAVLEFISTNENFSDRILGSNTTLTFPNNLELSLSANTGITYTPDLVRRCVFINLFLGMENPNERHFEKPDLHGWVKSHRSEVLSALYALVRVWHENKMPSGRTPFSSYSEWGRVCGGIMMVAELGDPCVTNNTLIEIGGDTESRDMKRLFELVYSECGAQPIEKKTLLNMVAGEGAENNRESFRELFPFLDWSNERSARTRLSLMIDRYIGREFSGIKMIRDEKDVGTHTEKRRYSWHKNERADGNLSNFGDLPTPSRPVEKDDISQVLPVHNDTKGRMVTSNVTEECIAVDKTDTSGISPPETNLPDIDIQQAILNLLGGYSEGIAKWLLISKLSGQTSPESIEKALAKLSSDGQIYEPRKDLIFLRD
jgi:putative DNA primase/helicase